jgi:hypothetical protein
MMKPRRTHFTNKVFRLSGGTEDNDLWAYIQRDDQGTPIVCSVWVPTEEERERIANGENIRLCVWGGQPPVVLDLTDEPLGKAPGSSTP